MDANYFISRIDVFEATDAHLERKVSTSGAPNTSTVVDEEVAVSSWQTMEIPQYREKERLLKVIIPFENSAGKKGCVSIVSSLRQSELVVEIQDRIAFFLVPASVMVLALLMHFLFARGITNRIHRMSQAMREARSGNLQSRAEAWPEDELGSIARSFNETMDEIGRAWAERDRLLEERSQANVLLQEKVREATRELEATNARLRAANEEIYSAQRQLTQVERMAVACQMAATFAHEIGSPLSAVSTHLQLLAEEASGEGGVARRVDLIQEQVNRVTRYVEELLSETRAAFQPRGSLQINEILERLLLFLEQHLSRLRIRIRTDLAPQLPGVLGNANQLHQVFLNLINNACDAMPGGGDLTLSAALEPDDRGRPFVTVRVSDTGIGIPLERQGRIFEPFFTTKEFSGGTGLGLSISARIVRQHGGSISFDSRPGAGTTFTVRLPVATQ